jgi:signal transduction histidine kinase
LKGIEPLSGEFTLDWAVLAVSLFNTIILVWLGLAVLLNAERRRLGVWVVGCGLLAGGVFFLGHSAVFGLGFNLFGQSVALWWQLSWIPVVALPFAWYVIMLWYTGFWDEADTPLRLRHRIWLPAAVLLTIATGILFIVANPLPTFTRVLFGDLYSAGSGESPPMLFLIFPLNLVFCIGLSLDVLRRPGPTGRVMGDIARSRARPWLVAASIVLLVVSLLIVWVMAVLLLGSGDIFHVDMAVPLAWLDLCIASLIGLAVVLTGQAIVSYEVFTGKTLPRRGLRRYWQQTIGLAAGYATLLGWSITMQFRPIFSLLLATIMMTVFYAGISWRSYVERERYMQQLRPLVVSQRLYDQLLRSSTALPADVDVETPFNGLCEDVLETQVAYLAALGPLSPFTGPPLSYPKKFEVAFPSLVEIKERFESPEVIWLALDPEQYGGANIAVPLWSELGLIGVLFLGEKRDGGLYTQEEIEIARTIGERLIDVWASAEMAGRLMMLQRQRLAESQVIDQQTRRVLHDELLPRLHTAMLALRSEQLEGETAKSRAIETLGEVHRQIADMLREMRSTTAPEVATLGLIGALRQVVEEDFPHSFDSVTWKVGEDVEQQIGRIPPLISEVLYYAGREAIRNAVKHGRGADEGVELHLRVVIDCKEGLEILIEDDGQGIVEKDSDQRSGGQGLAFHGTMMAVIGGSLSIESAPGIFTRVVLSLPRDAW